MNKRLRLAVRNAACTACKLHQQAEGDDVCVTGDGPNDAQIMVVTKGPIDAGTRLRKELNAYLDEAGIDPVNIMWSSAVKCRSWDSDPSKTDLKACRPYLTAEMDFVRPRFVLALGGEALFATTGRAGIMKYRGKLYNHNDTVIFPTISPSMVARNPGYRAGFVADLQYFQRLTTGNTTPDPYHTPGERVTNVTTKAGLKAMLTAIRAAGVVAYDLETTMGSEFAPDAAIVSVAFTTTPGNSMDGAHVWQLPLYHPESPWRHQWKKIVPLLGPALMAAKKRGGHNVKFDTRWLRHFGCHVVPTFCTIVMAALLDENRPKGLKPLSQQILGADPWGIDTKDLLTTPLDEVLVYNGLDTWHDMRLYFIFRKQMMERKRIARLFVHLMMPAVQELVDVERRGVYVDTERLMLNRADVEGKLQAVEELLMKHVPEDKPYPVNFNRSNFLVWWLYEHLKLPVLARGKTKDDGRAGDPSCAEAVMMMLAEDHEVPGLMLERTKWYKMISSFFGPYAEQLDVEHRIHTTFKPWGTVTGRLSSGKEDEEKITAKAQTRGVNLQQVPRDKLVRGVFGAPPGSSFVEADYSQIELRLAAFLANEPTMLHLYATGQDIHMAMAMRMTGKPASQITAEERKRAKAVNFGFLYGMGWHKFIQTAWSNYGLHVNEVEARGARKAFFDEFNRLPAWHSRQRQFATKYGYVTTPMGRVRHLPDIYSPDEGVRAEAERQAINSPVQGFASDMALLSLSLVSRQFKRVGLAGHPVGTVHDAVNFEIPNDELTRALPIIKRTMENLPLQRLFGIELSVPIVADLKIGRHWGGATEVPAQLIHDRTQLRGWLKEHAA